MKKHSKRQSGLVKPRPLLKWQTGDYDIHAEFKFVLPYQFLLLCKLVDKTPMEIIRDFTDNLSCGSWKREGKDLAKIHLIDYFVAQGYGQQHYTEEDIRNVFKEMDALGLLFPTNGKPKLIDLYAEWRDKQQSYFFKKWYKKPRRR